MDNKIHTKITESMGYCQFIANVRKITKVVYRKVGYNQFC